MIREIIVCDNNPNDAQSTKEIIQNFKEQMIHNGRISVYKDGDILIEDCKSGKIIPDIIFLDVELGDKNGIDVAKEINEILPTCQIIYLSEHLKYATEVYQTNHIYFVMKSELKDRMPNIIKRIQIGEKEEQKYIRLELRKNKYVAIKKSDIIFLERNGRYTDIHTKDGLHETHFTLNDLEEMLTDNYFLRCHNSYIVSMKHIASYSREIIIIHNDTEIPVSRRYQQEVKIKFQKWIDPEEW